jgi:hypothetical protein
MLGAMGSGAAQRLAVVGVADHSGWANLVTVGVAAGGPGAGDGRPVVVGRRRCELLDPSLPRQPYHAAEGLPAGEAEALVAQVTEAAREGARSALASLLGEVGHRDGADGTGEREPTGAVSPPGTGDREPTGGPAPPWTVAALALRARGGRPLPGTVAGVLASHAAMHAAEGQLYRDALAEAAAELGLDVVVHPRGAAVAEAASALGVDAARVDGLVGALGRTVGPPWQKEHREAAAAALAELARCTRVAVG